MPNLIEIQTDSYNWFLDEGLREMFTDILPIEDFQGKLSLEFVDYKLMEPKYTVEEARNHDANYSAPLHVTLRLTNKETGEIKSQDVFFGDFPLMTPQGTFIINGAERVIVSQLVRSSGVIIMKKLIRMVVQSLELLIFQAVEHGLNMKQMPRDLTMFVSTVPVSCL
ncbi:DNA-directed RNA polymerase subunit beta [Weissella viridescens]|uniref:DNA-directed RNA polymerase n=1 Tax=Weissella viridescens TaxID=1629 RepID=A0A380NWZ6_WEIVI|nr:DNA-directed RNA polymerase subunit beta [Weissella viridescens]